MAPTHQQLRWRAAILLANDTGASALSLRALCWEHLRIARRHTDISWPGRRHRRTRVEAPPVHAAIQELWVHSTDHGGGVFASRWGPNPYARLARALSALPPWNPTTRGREQLLPGTELDAVLAASCGPTTQQLRDRAVVLIGSQAALRLREATQLRDSSVTVAAEGLLINVPGRRSPAGLRTRAGPYDPVAAWVAWLDAKHHAGLTDPEQPAFTQLPGGSIVNARVNGRVLNYIVHGATQRAALTGEYPFTSLRSGWIRDSIRSRTPAHTLLPEPA